MQKGGIEVNELRMEIKLGRGMKAATLSNPTS